MLSVHNTCSGVNALWKKWTTKHIFPVLAGITEQNISHVELFCQVRVNQTDGFFSLARGKLFPEEKTLKSLCVYSGVLGVLWNVRAWAFLVVIIGWKRRRIQVELKYLLFTQLFHIATWQVLNSNGLSERVSVAQMLPLLCDSSHLDY